jgi:hypothetical protein
MNWNNLKDNCCPKCKHALTDNYKIEMHQCTNCDFAVGNEKFNNLINNLYKPKNQGEEIVDIDERLSQLNDLNNNECTHEEIHMGRCVACGEQIENENE